MLKQTKDMEVMNKNMEIFEKDNLAFKENISKFDKTIKQHDTDIEALKKMDMQFRQLIEINKVDTSQFVSSKAFKEEVYQIKGDVDDMSRSLDKI